MNYKERDQAKIKANSKLQNNRVKDEAKYIKSEMRNLFTT